MVTNRRSLEGLFEQRVFACVIVNTCILSDKNNFFILLREKFNKRVMANSFQMYVNVIELLYTVQKCTDSLLLKKNQYETKNIPLNRYQIYLIP